MFRFHPFRSELKVLTIIPHSDFRTPRYGFKALLLFVGKFQPFESKTDFSVFFCFDFSKLCFQGNNTVTKIPYLSALESNIDLSPLIAQ